MEKIQRGFSYSVTGGRGTAWGWIHIDLKPKMFKSNEQIVKAERIRMNEAFGLKGASDIAVPSSSAYYREYIERSAGKVPSVHAQPYWASIRNSPPARLPTGSFHQGYNESVFSVTGVL